jgi:hypothetical protein
MYWPMPRSALSARSRWATEKRASSGQAENQSIVQQFTSEGNMRHLERQRGLGNEGGAQKGFEGASLMEAA